MMRKLLYSFLFFISSKSFLKRLSTPSLGLLCVGMFFVVSSNYGQCTFGGSQSGSTKSIIYNREAVSGTDIGAVTFTNVATGQYVAVNVIQGLNYTISTSTNTGFIKRITLFNQSNTSVSIGTAVAGSNNGSATYNLVAGFTGTLLVRFNNDSCSSPTGSATITVTYTGGNNTVDLANATAEGSNSWIAHVYDFSSSAKTNPLSDANAFTNSSYLGSFTQINNVTGTTTSFSQGYGGPLTPTVPFTATGTSSQNFYGETFAVRYRMRSTLPAGCYFVKVKGDDGVRLSIDGVKVFDAWVQQGPTEYTNVLVYLNGNSQLVLEYYDYDEANVTDFTIYPADDTINSVNVINTAGPVYRCAGSNSILDGSTITYQGSNSNPSIKFQWQSSPDDANWTDINGATAEDYTVSTNPTSTTLVYYRRNITGAASNTGSCTYSTGSIAVITSQNVNAGTPVSSAATNTLCNQFTANWNALGTASGYYLDVSTNGSFSSFLSGYNGLDVGLVTSYNVTGLNPNITYYYRLRAYNKCRGSAPNTSSGVISTKTTSLTANAGAALSAICQGTTSGIMGGSVGGGATGVTWSGGTGTWINPNDPANARYTAGASESGNITLTLTASGGSCGTATASKIIAVNPNPTANAGGALAAICQGATSAAMGGSFGGGATGGTWSGGAGTWSNANDPGNAKYTAGASESGNITLTLTTSGGSCNTTSVSKTIMVNPNPTANAGGALAAICQGATSAAMGGSFGGGATGGTWSGGAGTWSNANDPANAKYTAGASESGNITLTLTTSGGSCNTTSVSKTIMVNSNPTANAGGTLAAICQGATSAAMGGSFGGGATGGTWSGGAGTWSNANDPANAKYTAGASESGNITLTLTTSGGSCNTASVSKTIMVNPNPTANAGGALAAICQGTTSAAMGGSVGGGATGGTWSGGAGIWSNANDSANAKYTAGASESGNITLTLTTSGGSCNTTSVSKTIMVNPNPTANAGGALAAICQGATSAAMGGSFGGGATGGTWSGGAGTWSNANDPANAKYTAGASESGNITLTLTTSGGSCNTTSVTKTIMVNPNPTANAGGALAAICQGATSAAMGGSVGGGATGGTWSGGAGTWSNANDPANATYTAGASESGNITLTLTTSGGSCNTTSISKTIMVNPNPTANAGGALAAICQGATSAAMGGLVGGGATGGMWSGGAGTWSNANDPANATYTAGASESGSITLTLTTSGGSCNTISVTKTITVTPKPTAQIVSQTNASCGSLGTITLDNLPAGDWRVNQTGQRSHQYSRVNAETKLVIDQLQAGPYDFIVTDVTTGCVSNLGSVVILDTSSSTEWDGTGWTQGTPNSDSSVTISSVTPNQPFENMVGADLTFCSLIVTATEADVIIPSTMTLTVTNGITSNGKLAFESGSSLLQGESAVNTGVISYKRKVSMRRYDVVYWATPVTDAGLTMRKFSPKTLFDKYYFWNQKNSQWVLSSYGTEVMKIGQGYSIRGPQDFHLIIPAPFEGIFVGTPNNGDVSVTVEQNKLNFIGNPYPSPINAGKLLLENKDQIGSLYFWTHNQPPQIVPGTNTYRYNSSDFVVYNGVGSTRVSGEPVTGADEFKGYIGAGQAFFSTTPGTVIKFNNGLREKSTENTQFYKTANEVEKNRLWLNIANSEGAFKQILIGYVEGATNSFDPIFDATSMGSNSYLDFYSLNESKKLTIQGRALPFDNTEVIPLGYKSTVDDKGDRNFTISIDHADGLFGTQPVYLEDKETGKTVDLSKENYTFFSVAGTYLTRFTLRYTSKTLGTDDFENLENAVLVSVKDKVVKITSSKETLKEVRIYNVGAQLLYSKDKINASELQIANLHSSDQVILVKITLENGHSFTKKVIFSNL